MLATEKEEKKDGENKREKKEEKNEKLKEKEKEKKRKKEEEEKKTEKTEETNEQREEKDCLLLSCCSWLKSSSWKRQEIVRNSSDDAHPLLSSERRLTNENPSLPIDRWNS